MAHPRQDYITTENLSYYPIHHYQPVDTHQRQPFTPIPPSASNFRPDVSNFLSHYPQPQFHVPVCPVSSYSQQCSQYSQQQQPYQCYPPHHPADTVNSPHQSPVPPASIPKALPAVEHIPLLSGQSNFSAWNGGVQSLILYLGFAGHIANPPASGITQCPDRIPSYPPFLSTMPTAAKLATSRIWWEEDM